MFEVLDDPLSLSPATAEQRTNVLARGRRLRRRRQGAQLVLVVALVALAAVGLFSALGPMLTSSHPQPASPFDPEARILYEGRWGQDKQVIYVRNADGSQSHPLAPLLNCAQTNNGHAKPACSMWSPEWAPDGHSFVFASVDSNHETQVIFRADADGSNARPLFTCVTCTQATWSPDGTSLAYVTLDRFTGFEVRVFDLGSGRSRVISRIPAVSNNFAYGPYGPRWSPDGSRVVFGLGRVRVPGDPALKLASESPQRPWQIAVVAADGSDVADPQVITPPQLLAAEPDWSPDGTRIVFSANPPDAAGRRCPWECSTRNMFTVRPDGSELTQVTHFVGSHELQGEETFRSASQPRWTPDGRYILFRVTEICRGAADCPGSARTARATQMAFVTGDGEDFWVLPGRIFGGSAVMSPATTRP